MSGPIKFMTPTTPVTQRDVAQACGLHHSTVCLALKNSPALTAATRRRIQKVAQRLGYQPNASAYNLAALRKDRAPHASLPLAWINQERSPRFWREHPVAKLSFTAARQAAGELGYHLDEFWLHEPGLSVVRLTQILRSRGIQGVVFPIYRSSELDLGQTAWAPFSCVALNDHRLSRWVEVVSPDYYHQAELALRAVGEGRPVRAGLVLDAAFDALTNGLVRSSYLRWQDEFELSDRIPPCLLSPPGFAAARQLAAWVQVHRPAVVLAGDAESASALAANPHIAVRAMTSGLEAAAEAVASAAVEIVGRKIQRFETGTHPTLQLHLIRAPRTPDPTAAAAIDAARIPSLAA